MMPFLTVCVENSRLSGDGSPKLTEAAEATRNGVTAAIQVLCSLLTRPVSLSQAITLDFSRFLTDTYAITSVPPLPLVGDVHLERVSNRSTHSPCPSRFAVTHIKGEFFFWLLPNLWSRSINE